MSSYFTHTKQAMPASTLKLKFWEIATVTTKGLVWGYFQGGSIVMQISIAMLIFLSISDKL